MRFPFKAYTNISLCFKVSQAFYTFTLLLWLTVLHHLRAQACICLRCPIFTPQPTWLCPSTCFPPAECPSGPRLPVLIMKADLTPAGQGSLPLSYAGRSQPQDQACSEYAALPPSVHLFPATLCYPKVYCFQLFLGLVIFLPQRLDSK